MSVRRILHLVGSAENDFYCDLSRLYAKDCIAATMNRSVYEFLIAYISPGGQWCFPLSLSQEDIAGAERFSLAGAIDWITSQKIDVVLPQMFCLGGMTKYRALFDLLGIPYVGNTPGVMALAADKAKTKAVVAAAGVKVVNGELLRFGDRATIKPPIVIKPSNSDNSFGVSLVKNLSDYDRALKTAFEYSEEVLVEEYIELGREVRCGVIEKKGNLVNLPLEEYLMDVKDRPIRQYIDKLKRAKDGELDFSAKEEGQAWIVDLTDPLTEKVQEMARKCHQALGCRHYSLFDFRIDREGQPWFLEAGLYCSFAPKSVIPSLAKASGLPIDKLLSIALEEALNC